MLFSGSISRIFSSSVLHWAYCPALNSRKTSRLISAIRLAFWTSSCVVGLVAARLDGVEVAGWETAPGGRALLTVQSKRGYSYGKGQPLEPDTFLRDEGADAGVPHHYFDEQGLRELFADFAIVELFPVEWDEMKGGAAYRHAHWAIVVEKPMHAPQ